MGKWWERFVDEKKIASDLISWGIRGAIVLGFGLLIAIWTNAWGASLPWVVTAGVFAGGAGAWAIGGVLFLRTQLARNDKRSAADDEKARRAARLIEVKAILRERLEAVPKNDSLLDLGVWTLGTSHLLSKMYLGKLPQEVLPDFGESHCKIRHHENLAHLMSLIANLSPSDLVLY